MLELERTKDGTIKDFTVTDAHHLYVTAWKYSDPNNPVKQEALAIPDLDFLDKLQTHVDPEDGLIIGKKWAITDEVIKILKSKGECTHHIPGFPLIFKYVLKRMRYADELKSKG